MKSVHFVHGIAIAAFIAAIPQPASAQVGDFLCSTLSIGCPPPPPPPPPPAPLAAEPAPAPVVKHKRKKAKKKAAAPKAEAEPAAQ